MAAQKHAKRGRRRDGIPFRFRHARQIMHRRVEIDLADAVCSQAEFSPVGAVEAAQGDAARAVLIAAIALNGAVNSSSPVWQNSMRNKRLRMVNKPPGTSCRLLEALLHFGLLPHGALVARAFFG